MVFGSILVTSIISVCLHTGMFVKVTKSFLRVKTIHQACGSCLFENQKVNCRISCCLCHKNEVQRRGIFLCCCKEVKKFDQPGFSGAHSRKWYQKLHWAPCYWWGVEDCCPDEHNCVCIQTKWKNTPWTCYQNLENVVSQRKTRSQESILNRYSEDIFDFWMCWRFFWSVVAVCQESSSVQCN